MAMKLILFYFFCKKNFLNFNPQWLLKLKTKWKKLLFRANECTFKFQPSHTYPYSSNYFYNKICIYRTIVFWFLACQFQKILWRAIFDEFDIIHIDFLSLDWIALKSSITIFWEIIIFVDVWTSQKYHEIFSE